MKTATFNRYVSDPTSSEQELESRGGSTVKVLSPLTPELYDFDEVGAMYVIEFPDGLRAEAFDDELSDWSDE